MENKDEEKMNIMKGLVKSEKDTLAKLAELVGKAQKILFIEQETGKTIPVKTNIPLSDAVRIQLVGSYFAGEMGLRSKKSCNLDDLKSALSVEGRALSRLLGDLVKNNSISDENGEYTIKPYIIDTMIDELVESGNTNKIIAKKQILKRKKQIASGEEQKNEVIRTLDENGIAKLGEATGLDRLGLSHIFDFDTNTLKVIFPVANENEAESVKQIHGALLYLTGLKFCYGTQEISSSELRAVLTDLGIKSIDNLSTSLKANSTSIIHKKGLRGCNDTSYRLTVPGELEGLKLIKKIGGELNGQETNN